ncbi:MAG: leucyl-tRNA synthetase, partial [Patescibacteria group bacterium]|nr:leucyl-tRNA synthetase [Patescibacteria group bacterium]
KLLHKTIKKVGEDIEAMRFNTAISSMMILATEMQNSKSVSLGDFKMFLQILSPFAPHVAEELWQTLGEKKSINLSPWPKYDEKLLKDDEVKIVIQVNGKVRGEFMINADLSEDEVKAQALKEDSVIKHLGSTTPKRIIYVKNRLINIVI